jgi:hypothetical protein
LVGKESLVLFARVDDVPFSVVGANDKEILRPFERFPIFAKNFFVQKHFIMEVGCRIHM